MSSINPEMLKQLLAEFEEKQAVCREEINAIEEQIKELEKRIESSKERLQSVAVDKDKILLMKQRYADGDWSAVLAQIKERGVDTNGARDKATVTQETPVVSVASQPVQLQASTPPAPAPAPAPVQEVAPPAFALEPQPAPAPAPAPAPIPEPQAPALPMQPAGIPAPPLEPNIQPAQQGSPPQFQMEAPSWDPPQTFQLPEPAAAPQPQPQAPPQPSEGLFPFSQQGQATDSQQGDIPWAPPPSMTWESVGAGTDSPFPPQQAPQSQEQPQQPAQMPGAPDLSGFGAPPFAQGPAPSMEVAPPLGFGDPSAAPPGMPVPPQGFQQAPPQPNQLPNAALSSAFDEEFDISDALRGDDDTGGKDKGDNDKKIKDALRGLFS